MGTFEPDLTCLLAAHDHPDVVVLTETKMTKKRIKHNIQQADRKVFAQRYDAHATNALGGAPRAGVLLLLKKDTFPTSRTLPPPATAADALRGHVVHVRAETMLGEALELMGVYNPCTSAPGASDTRTAVLHALTRSRRKADGIPLLVAGDFNAALYDTDRPAEGSTAADAHYREAVTSAGLHAADAPQHGQQRPRTLSTAGKPHSRIDDALLNSPEAAAAARVAVGNLQPWGTDHIALHLTVPWAALGMHPPVRLAEPAAGPPRRVLERPLRESQLRRAAAAIEAELGGDLEALAAEAGTLLASDVARHWAELESSCRPDEVHTLRTLGGRDAHPVVTELMHRFHAAVVRGQEILLETCDTRETNPSGRSYRRRGEHKLMRLLRRACGHARALLRGERSAGEEAPAGPLRAHLETAGWLPGTDPTEEHCAAAQRSLQKAKRDALREERKQAAEQARARAEQQAHRSQKQSNKVATGAYKDKDPTEGRVFRHPRTGELLTAPDAI
jgi:exonuclease III